MDFLANGRKVRKYSPRLRTFAITLHFYSPRAYRYVRSIFDNKLPAVSTIRKWYTAINGKPGFSDEAFDALKIKANDSNSNGKEILGCVIFDEVAIRKQEEFDEQTASRIGFVNFGTNNIGSNEKVYAKEALVYMVTGINEKFKIPVAYFLTSGLKSPEKAALTQEVILRVTKAGVKVVGLTFDGLNSNIAMTRVMGASIKKGKPFIVNPHSNDKIYLYPDACHMLKCARNCLARNQTLYDGDGNTIKWQYIVALVNFQQENKINLGNKVNKTHAQWEKHMMSVRIAAETISNSVADALDFLRNKGVEEFVGSEATTKFIRRINNVFDISNSMHENALCFKRPISPKTEKEYFEYFDESIRYMKGLKLRSDGKSILLTKSKMPFLGFTIILTNFRSFYMEYVSSNILPHVLTFRFSQDHLELLFASIRQMFGCNDNPSAKQFESAWRRLLGQHQITASKSANCANNDTMYLTVLNASSRKKTNDKLKKGQHGNENNILIAPKCILIDDEEIINMRSIVLDPVYSDNLKGHMISYMACVIQQNIIHGRWYAPISCEKCLNAFSEDEYIDDEFIELKIKTQKLRPAARSTFQICFTAEKLLEKNEFKPIENTALLNELLQIINLNELFSYSDFSTHSESGHKLRLVRLVVNMFLRKRQEYISRCNTLDAHETFWRRKLKKVVHFKGQ